MCTRIAIPDSLEIEKAWPAIGHGDTHPARYNVAPGAVVPIVARTTEGTRFISAHWGFHPASRSTATEAVTARSEDAGASPTWQESFRTGRCLVPALGWYERKEDGDARPGKTFFIRRSDGSPVFLAALIKDASVPTFVILTRAASSSTAERLPLVVQPEDFAGWLEIDQTDERTRSITSRPLAEDLLDTFPVRALADHPANDGPEFIQPIQEWPHPPTGTRELPKRPHDPIG
jgi:putative SOS response-associated peptidase YedK